LRFSLNNNAKFITELSLKFKYLKSQLVESAVKYYKDKNDRLAQQKKLLESLSPTGILERGYAFVESDDGEIIKSSKTKKTNITIHFNDGSRKAKLENE
jgi:exodeoxyribonuclease VII large subunit